MKKLVVISFIIILIFQSGGLILLLLNDQMNIKLNNRNINADISKDLTELIIPESEFKSLLINKYELVYKGSMYDIYQSMHKGNLVYIKAHLDSKENEIIEFINNLKNDIRSKASIKVQLIKFLSGIYLIFENKSKFDEYNFLKKTLIFIRSKQPIIYLNKIIPPPKFSIK